jgi:hypothetical protein
MSPTVFQLVRISDLCAKPSLPVPKGQDLVKATGRIIDFGQDNPIVVNLSGEVIYGGRPVRSDALPKFSIHLCHHGR